jgi:hypothetical protein
MSAVLAVRAVHSLAELGDELRWKVEEAEQEIARLTFPGEMLPGMTKRPTRGQVARYTAVLETKVDAWREVLAAMGQEV